MKKQLTAGKLFVFGLMALLTTQFSSCGGGGSSSSGGLGDATSVEGTVYAANGTDPISGAVVYIPTEDSSESSSLSAIVSKSASATCEEPSETSCGSVCTDENGKFTLTPGDPSTCGSTKLKFKKGTFTGEQTLDCASNTTSGVCTLADKFKVATDKNLAIAVVTGAYDEIENTLAKLGLGELETSTGVLKIGTEKFTIFRGGGSRDYSGYTDTTKYKASSALFGSLTEMKKYDIIFINCGSNEDVSPSSSESPALTAKGDSPKLSHAEYHKYLKTKLMNSSVVSNIKDYVNAGGKMYATDLAYDFVEQTFPGFMDFQDGGDGSSTTAETEDAAQDGTSGIKSDATLNNAAMKSWVSGSSIKTNTINSTTSPNSSACTTTANGNSGSQNLNSDGTIRIGDFLSGWGVMKAAYDADTFVWITGKVKFSGATDTTNGDSRPLTASRKVGSSGGCLLYSSYHNSHSCPTTGFWPQERVLHYLVFEVSSSCTP